MTNANGATFRHDRVEWRSPRRAPCATSAAKPPANSAAASSADITPANSAEFIPWDVEQLLLRTCEREPLPLGGCLIRGLLTEREQIALYEYILGLCDHASNDVSRARDQATPEGMAQYNTKNGPQQIVNWRHPYSHVSSARKRPDALFAWTQQLMHALVQKTRQADVEIDSFLAQLYAPGGALRKHQDEDLSWGISISLGAPAAFDAWDGKDRHTRKTLYSGDVCVCEFGQMFHAVEVRKEEAAPPLWWAEHEHFGTKVRCNLLFRQALTAKQQRRRAEKFAMIAHGTSDLAALARMMQTTEQGLIGLLCQLRR